MTQPLLLFAKAGELLLPNKFPGSRPSELGDGGRAWVRLGEMRPRSPGKGQGHPTSCPMSPVRPIVLLELPGWPALATAAFMSWL